MDAEYLTDAGKRRQTAFVPRSLPVSRSRYSYCPLLLHGFLPYVACGYSTRNAMLFPRDLENCYKSSYIILHPPCRHPKMFGGRHMYLLTIVAHQSPGPNRQQAVRTRLPINLVADPVPVSPESPSPRKSPRGGNGMQRGCKGPLGELTSRRAGCGLWKQMWHVRTFREWHSDRVSISGRKRRLFRGIRPLFLSSQTRKLKWQSRAGHKNRNHIH